MTPEQGMILTAGIFYGLIAYSVRIEIARRNYGTAAFNTLACLFLLVGMLIITIRISP